MLREARWDALSAAEKMDGINRCMKEAAGRDKTRSRSNTKDPETLASTLDVKIRTPIQLRRQLPASDRTPQEKKRLR
eukprot:7869084-Pyramimonas_sp.AAC.1